MDQADRHVERRAEVADREGVDGADVPADALTASASGLDPHISPAYALLQVPRVAEANGLSVDEVEDLPAVLDQLGAQGYGLVGGMGEWEGAWRMAYVRGPEGIIVSLADQIG